VCLCSYLSARTLVHVDKVGQWEGQRMWPQRPVPRTNVELLLSLRLLSTYYFDSHSPVILKKHLVWLNIEITTGKK